MIRSRFSVIRLSRHNAGRQIIATGLRYYDAEAMALRLDRENREYLELTLGHYSSRHADVHFLDLDRSSPSVSSVQSVVS